MTKITDFSGEYRWLSNFWPCQVELDGVLYPSVEHAYQAAKTLVLDERKQFEIGTAGQAKRNGKSVTIRIDWNLVKLSIMESLLTQKFQDEVLSAKLSDTGDVLLIEGNDWGDVFWGMCNGQGENHLGKLLMNIREGLLEQESLAKLNKKNRELWSRDNPF